MWLKKNKSIHNHSLPTYLGDRVFLDLHKSGVGWYFAYPKDMWLLPIIISLPKPQFSQEDIVAAERGMDHKR